MDLDLISPSGESQIKKILFNLKGSHSNGLLLQIHPSFTDSHGENKQCRFLHCTFSENNLLAVSDASGNIYIVDMQMEKYWQLPHAGIVTAISFPHLLKSKLLIASESGPVEIVHIETGNVISALIGHAVPVKEISYSHDGKHCLTSNSVEAIIWNLVTNCQAHKLSLKDNILLKKAHFMPVQNSIFACFHDDAMHIWKFGDFECIKQIIPEGWKAHHLKSVAFTRNGRAMVLGGCSPNIVIFCLDTWSIRKVVQLPNGMLGVKYMEFLPQTFDGGANRVLGIVTNSSELYFLDVESSVFLNNVTSLDKLVGSFSVSPSGKYLATVHISGEVNVYVTEKILWSDGNVSIPAMNSFSTPSKVNGDVRQWVRSGSSARLKHKWAEELKAVRNELKQELNLKKLVPILRQFGEYPESYRVIIWRTILQLPLNQEAFVSLAKRECHPNYVRLESKYSMVNKALCNALKRVLSCLAHWCPLFGEVSFLPEFVFPFVKLLHFDPFVCFESVATVIVNWCQNWFEFYPFPPINVLSMVENVLGHHDSDLLEFYVKRNITSSVYACGLMETAFSEVLTKSEWVQLWDHIISNEPSFMIMAVVAYNIVCRNSIQNCFSNGNSFDFFHSQNPIDMKLLLAKCYHFLDKTPPDIHPRRYLSPFSPLPNGYTYSPFEAYPKLVFHRNAAKLQKIQMEERAILREQQKAIALKKELEKKLRPDKRAEFRESVLTELDDKFRDIINAEEERISVQRQKLRNLRHELKLKELSVLEEVRNEIIKKRSRRRENEVGRLLKEIEMKRSRESCEMESAEEEINKYYAGLLMRRYRLRMDLDEGDDAMAKLLDELRGEEDKLRAELRELQSEIALGRGSRNVDSRSKVSAGNDVSSPTNESDGGATRSSGEDVGRSERETLDKRFGRLKLTGNDTEEKSLGPSEVASHRGEEEEDGEGVTSRNERCVWRTEWEDAASDPLGSDSKGRSRIDNEDFDADEDEDGDDSGGGPGTRSHRPKSVYTMCHDPCAGKGRESSRSRNNRRRTSMFPFRRSESDSSTTPSERENSTVNVSLSERRRLVEEAKLWEPFTC